MIESITIAAVIGTGICAVVYCAWLLYFRSMFGFGFLCGFLALGACIFMLIDWTPKAINFPEEIMGKSGRQ